MASSDQPHEITVEINAGPDSSPEELDRLTLRLRSELEEIDVPVRAPDRRASPPQGAKGAGALAVGSLMIAVMPKVLPQVVDFIQKWTMRADGRTVKIKTQIGDRSIEVECSAVTAASGDLLKLVNALTERISKTK